MPSSLSQITFAVLLAALAGTAYAAGNKPAASSGGKAIKCWTNKEGVRECGNVVPPEYSQDEHEQVSSGGAKVKKTDKARTEAELEAERQAAVQKKAAEDEAHKQAARDKVLLDTYSSEGDLLLSRDGQLANIDSQIKLTESHIDKLHKQQDVLIQQAADDERRGKAVPPKLANSIDDLGKQIEENKQFIVNKGADKDRLREKFDADIKRFHELRARQ
ncbi:MAG: hypothetical protein HY749_09440 [Gammaproteobacteria bacterium]|nr:hypothetical protein [Gammaproteobacteria bacterium]MBI5616370.1 hypothetical protein [Gammaproteobacteria bacterium]